MCVMHPRSSVVSFKACSVKLHALTNAMVWTWSLQSDLPGRLLNTLSQTEGKLPDPVAYTSLGAGTGSDPWQIARVCFLVPIHRAPLCCGAGEDVEGMTSALQAAEH